MNTIYISVLYVHESEHEGFEQNCLVNLPTGVICKVEDACENDQGCYAYVVNDEFTDEVEEWVRNGSDNPYTQITQREI